MKPSEKAEIRRELLDEMITGYDQLIEIFKTGGDAPLTGHAFDPKETEREIKLVEDMKKSLIEMRDQEAAAASKVDSDG